MALFYATRTWLNTVYKNYCHQAMLRHLVVVSNDSFDNEPGKTYTNLLLLFLMSHKARAYKRYQTTIQENYSIQVVLKFCAKYCSHNDLHTMFTIYIVLYSLLFKDDDRFHDFYFIWVTLTQETMTVTAGHPSRYCWLGIHLKNCCFCSRFPS
jgi:hypothetical protein